LQGGAAVAIDSKVEIFSHNILLSRCLQSFYKIAELYGKVKQKD